MNKVLTAICILCLFAASCSSYKDVSGRKVPRYSAEELNTLAVSQQKDFDYFSAKAKIVLEEQDNKQSVNAQIKMQRDSVIWVSFRWLGIEAARVLITPDSVKIIDRLQRKYYPRGFNYLALAYDIDADFETLQNLIIGNLVYYEEEGLTSRFDRDAYVLISRSDSYETKTWLNPFDFSISRMEIYDSQYERELKVHYLDYQEVGNRLFSADREISILADDAYSIGIGYSKVAFDEPQSFAFQINPKYETVY